MLAGLAALAAMGPLALLALGLTETEATRIRVQTELTVRILRGQRQRRLGSLETFVADLRTRGLQWPRHTAGVTGIDAHGRIVLDRALFEGGSTSTFIDYVVIAEGTFYAARHDQGWIDA